MLGALAYTFNVRAMRGSTARMALLAGGSGRAHNCCTAPYGPLWLLMACVGPPYTSMLKKIGHRGYLGQLPLFALGVASGLRFAVAVWGKGSGRCGGGSQQSHSKVYWLESDFEICNHIHAKAISLDTLSKLTVKRKFVANKLIHQISMVKVSI